MSDNLEISAMHQKPRLFLLYPYYWPLYKAGGPVQSLFNLVNYFQADAEFFIVSLIRDIDGEYSNEVPSLRQWTKGPNNENIYFSPEISVFLIYKVIREVNPDVIFVNGIFNANTTLPGLFLGKILQKKIVISPRGMLQQWALDRRPTLKKIYLFALRILLSDHETWHATDDQEKRDILRIFGKRQYVNQASNIPRKLSPLSVMPFPNEQGKIKLVFLSLINPNKNLHHIIDQISGNSIHLDLDIYGPIVDRHYWNYCMSRVKETMQISYKGSVPAWNVPGILSQYHFFILPTQGENFGHAIFDALSSGVPVIVSRKTPWLDIDKVGAGFYLDEPFPESIQHTIQKISRLSADEYNEFRKRSLNYAATYLSKKNYAKDYSFLIES